MSVENGSNTFLIEGDSIGKLKLSFKIYICLTRAGINTVSDLCKCTNKQLKGLPGFEERYLSEIKDKLKEFNLSLNFSGKSKIVEEYNQTVAEINKITLKLNSLQARRVSLENDLKKGRTKKLK